MAHVKIKEEKTGNVIEYYMEDRLKNSLDKKVIPSLHQKDKDFIICIDGREGVGKSVFSLQLGKYIDPTLNLSRVVFSPEDFREAILKAKKGECIVYDEAFTGFSSRASLSPINRVLVSLAMQMRQKNLCVIIVLPTIFLLDKYMALFRTRALIHVFESHGRRGYFKLYNYRLKKLLILLGQKTMSYNNKLVRSHFRGRFYGKFALGDEKVEKKYRKMKEQALADSEKTSMTSAQVRYRDQRDLSIYLLRKITNLTYDEISNLLLDYDISISTPQVGKICAKFGDTQGDKVKKALENREEKERLKEERGKKEEISIEDMGKVKDIKEKEEEIDDIDTESIESDEKEEDNEDFE
ncbi:MAG TPA: hypothetical protein VJ438_06055 [Candidatus Nanoarchaeia archaeon]|nr:hypothetical protein [Candidatus Nanoarchaeia archaeon]